MSFLKIAVIGGGAAGLMAACSAEKNDRTVIVLYEKNAFLGKKLAITGKGRCNVTNTASVAEMEQFILRGAKFLRTALYAFPPEAVRSFFEEAGVPLKEERGGRVFPVSDKARDVVDALAKKALEDPRVTLRKEAVLSVDKTERGFLIKSEKRTDVFDRVLIATGGKSYPLTGSTGDGYRFAEANGHSIVPPAPALVPLTVKESLPLEAMGLSLKNCALKVKTLSGKTVYEDFGEMLFCHFGISGPMVLSASSHLDFQKETNYRVFLDLKPALTEEMLDRRILSDFEENRNRDLINAMNRLLPQKLIAPVLNLAVSDARKKVHLVTREERRHLVEVIKNLPLTVTGTRPLAEGIITRGGVSLKEIDPRTMESRLTPGLFFAGEVMDADALTGGFNLQIAFSTGFLAGESISREEL
ncbi:MAG: NAD(P)/FAD-dependent oxidoreductase [Clostridia bacterium]|nr:NAD(P)/FAD-dependent oxidoreductase [Clostridia bacterium]